MGFHKTKLPMFPKELIWPAEMIPFATDSLSPFAFPQNAAQTGSDPAVKDRKRPLMAMFEVFKPSLKHSFVETGKKTIDYIRQYSIMN